MSIGNRHTGPTGGGNVEKSGEVRIRHTVVYYFKRAGRNTTHSMVNPVCSSEMALEVNFKNDDISIVMVVHKD